MSDQITEEPETNAERREREAFEALTPIQQQQYLTVLIQQFNSVPSHVERIKRGEEPID